LLHRPHVVIPTTYSSATMNYDYNEHSVRDRTTSKTVDCQRYLFELDGLRIHFIDTPGINDTGGLLQDAQNVEKVFSYIENISELTALILILNGAVARVTINIQNVLATYRDRLPDAIYSNIIIVLTNCEEHTVNFSPSNVNLGEHCSVFHMQNSAFSSDSRTWSSDGFTALQRQFVSSMKTMDRIFGKLLSLEPTSTKLFQEMNDDRNRIKQQLHRARITILDLQNLEDELVAFELSADIHAANAGKFQNFIRTRNIMQTREIPTPYHNTRCFYCDTVCHRNCLLKEVRQHNSQALYHCSAMDSRGHCQNCPNHCPASSHFHARYITEKCMTSVNDIVESMQQRYFQAREGKKAADSKCNDLQTSKKFLESELRLQYKEVYSSIHGLQKACKELNITAILFQFIELLEKDASRLKSPSVVQKSHEFIGNLKQICHNSEQSNNKQQTPQLMSHERRPSKQTMLYGKSKGEEGLEPTNKLNDEESNHQNGTEFRTHVYQNVDDHIHKTGDQEVSIDTKSTEHKERLQLQQHTTDERFLLKLKIERENLDMLPYQKLIQLLNSSMSDHDIDEIKQELQRRSSGESIGFLTRDEQLVLCEQYAKHQQMKYTDLIQISATLIKETEQLTSDDQLKYSLIPVEKRLQLSAINLLIKRKD
jgi:hypothetical protein